MALAFQIKTGVGHKITENLDVFWGYRLFRSSDFNFNYDTLGILTSEDELDPVWVHQIEAGMRVRF